MSAYSTSSGHRPIRARRQAALHKAAEELLGTDVLRQIADSRWFALADLLLVLACGAAWMIRSRLGIGIILVALVPWGIRLTAGQFPFRRTALDWLIAVFLATAWSGYWAAYDKTTAWDKIWLITTAILFYYALVAQPRENLLAICVLFFCIGVGVSLYYFLTYDFIAAPRKLEFVNRIGHWLMDVRPQLGWAAIHPNYAAGVAAITTPFVIYPVREISKRRDRPKFLLYALISAGLGIVFSALVMTTSRGAVMAIGSALGVWLLWRFAKRNEIRHRVWSDALFPSLVLIYLCTITVFLYLGPAKSANIFTGHYYYGDGSREELLSRSLYLLWDYPITGGGLGSFPGLYSQYILNIPNFNVLNSHNLFLDVAIEQGLLGGLAFVLLYLAGIWLVGYSLVRRQPAEGSLFNWIVLFSLIVAVVHGMVDDYLFNSAGTILSLFLVALSVRSTQGKDLSGPPAFRLDRRLAGYALLLIALMFVFSPKKILSTWYANLGSVRMSQVELKGFPNNGWAGSALVPDLKDAEAALRSSLQFDPTNRTANQRLGMISMLRQDFESAGRYLEAAHKRSPQHRGIVKSLGYCYVWLGDLPRAEPFLARIPESQEELDAYIWWWGIHGRYDLSHNATIALQNIRGAINHP